MPGPDDTLLFLQKYAQEKGYTIPENIDSVLLGKLRQKAEAIQHGRRGLDALLNFCCTPVQPPAYSPHATSLEEPECGYFRSVRGT